MAKYSIVVILYILVQIISLLLLIILIYSLLKSEPHFTKWTLFQLFVSAFGNGFSALPPIFYHGDELAIHAFENDICLISNKIANFFLYPTEFFPLVIAFYLWYVLYKKRGDIEKKCFWWLSIIIWIFSIAYNVLESLMTRHEKDYGILVTPLNCKRSKRSNNFYAVPAVSLSFVAFIMTGHSSTILYKEWRRFNHNQNRTTAINLGRAVRLNILCIVYILFLLSTLIPQILSHPNDPKNTSLTLSSFMGATPGILLFLIFGAKKRAALFLPCSFCYYVSPDRPTRYPDENGSFYMETDVISPTPVKVQGDHESIIELDSIKNNVESSSSSVV